MITAEEKLAKLREKQAQLKAQEKKIIAQENAKARKARTKRLIEIGAAAESILGRPFQDNDLQKFLNFLKQQEARGNYYSKAMNNTNTQTVSLPPQIHIGHVILSMIFFTFSHSILQVNSFIVNSFANEYLTANLINDFLSVIRNYLYKCL